MRLEAVIAHARSVGVTISPVTGEGHGNLYAWHDPYGEIFYIGKAASPARARDEAGWVESATAGHLHAAEYVVNLRNEKPFMRSTFTTTVIKNNLTCTQLRFEDNGFDPNVAEDAIRTAGAVLADHFEGKIASAWYEGRDGSERFAAWLREDFEREGWLTTPTRVTSAEVEKFLVRLLARDGKPTANAQFAGQWEAMLDTPADDLAAIALLLPSR